MIEAHPQNPYGSFLVNASAGCGKTFQLSQRFLCLVAAGAHPAHILTITFTTKAAAEMRSRIIEDAANLLYHPHKQSAFDQQMLRFYAETRGQHAVPKNAVQVAQTILRCTQQLHISTIDSLFYQWLKKFPLEASDAAAPLPTRAQLGDSTEMNRIFESAWDGVCAALFSQDLNHIVDLPTALIDDGGILGLRQRIFGLLSFESLVWLRTALGFPQLTDLPTPNSKVANERDLIEHLLPTLEKWRADLSESFADGVASIRSQKTLESLHPIFNSQYAISGTYVRGKKREQYSLEITELEELVRNFVNAQRVQDLKLHGEFLMKVFHAFSEFRDQLKYQESKVDFFDLTRAAFRLFHKPDNASVQYLLHKQTQHLLIDEFQDTNRLQWDIFSAMARNALAGNPDSGLTPTVFMVGDPKQSIYGFREADAQIMLAASQTLAPFGLQTLPLNHSFRSSALMLDFVNETCASLLPDFGTHQAAQIEGRNVTPDVGFIRIFDTCESHDDQEKKPVEREAELIADQLQTILSQAEDFPVYDKANKRFRPIRPSDCAILFRVGTHAASYENALRQAQIACVREQSQGFFARQEILDAMALLRYVAFPADTLSLLQFLKSPFSGVTDATLLELAAETLEDAEFPAARNRRMLSLLKSTEPQLQMLIDLLETDAHRMRPHELLLSITEEVALRSYPSLYPTQEAHQAIANLYQLVETCQQIEQKSGSSFANICQHLMEEKWADGAGNAATIANAVTLMTIHKAKGLEFPLVILADAASSWEKSEGPWLRSKNADGDDALYYIGNKNQRPMGSIEFDMITENAQKLLAAESARLLYVALTRARQYLLVTGYRDAKKQPLHSTGFLQHLRESALRLPEVEHKIAESVPYLQIVRKSESSDQIPELIALPPSALHPNPCDSDMPNQYLAREILTVKPSSQWRESKRTLMGASRFDSRSAAAVYGTLVHQSLEYHFKAKSRDMQESLAPFLKTNPDLKIEELHELYSLGVRESQAVLNSSTWKNLMQGAVKIRPEQKFLYATGSALVRGTMDLVIEKEDEILLVDFKTSAGDPSHLAQMELYRSAATSLYKDKPVRAVLFYTESQTIQEL